MPTFAKIDQRSTAFMFIEKRKFKNFKGLTLSAIYEGEHRNAPLVILCHGYGSSKDSEGTRDLTIKLVSRNLSVFRFDFTGCGESDGIFEDDLTPNAGLDDLNCAIKQISAKSFALYGSSFGGYVSLIYASHNPVLALGLKAPVSDFIEVIKKRPLGRSSKFYEEVKNTDLYKDAKNIKCPVLIIHGHKDDVVPLAQSKKLIGSIKGQKKLEILKGADHDIKAGYGANALLADFFAKNLI